MGTLSYTELTGAGVGSGGQLGWQCRHAWSRTPDVTLAACCDINLAAAERFAANHPGVRAYGSIAEMVRGADPDLVSVTSPAAAHAENVEEILGTRGIRRIGLWVEKPSAITLPDHDRIVLLARERSAVVTFGYDKLYSDIEWIRKLIKSGVLGDVREAHARWNGTRRAPLYGAFLNRDVSGGGPGFDLASHLLALILYALREPFGSVIARTSRAMFDAGGTLGDHDHSKTTVEDTFWATLTTAQRGIPVTVDTTWEDVLARDEWFFRIKGTRGTAELKLRPVGEDDERLVASAVVRPGDGIRGRRLANGLVRIGPGRPGRSLQQCRQALLTELAQAVRDKRSGWPGKVRVTPEIARDVLAALVAGYASAADGSQPVPVDG